MELISIVCHHNPDPSSNSIAIQYYDGTQWKSVPLNSSNLENKIRITDSSSANKAVSISNDDNDIQTFSQIYQGSEPQIQIQVFNSQKNIKVGSNENNLNRVGQTFTQKFISIDWGTSGTRTIDIINGNGNGNKNTVYNGNLEHLFISYGNNASPGETGHLGPDGVLQIYPTIQGGTEVYMEIDTNKKKIQRSNKI